MLKPKQGGLNGYGDKSITTEEISFKFDQILKRSYAGKGNRK